MLPIPLLIISGSFAAPAPVDPVRKAQEELQGTWKCVGIEAIGEKATPQEVKEEDYSITIKGNEITCWKRKRKQERYTFHLDPSKSPPHIDLKELGDRARPGVCHAIYELKKGELKICSGTKWSPDEPEQRPQEFATIRGSEKRPPKGKLLLIFQREKK